MYDELIDPYDQEPLRAIKDLPAEEVNVLLASVLATVSTSTYPISEALVASVFKREMRNGESVALREALRYIGTVENYATKNPTKHTDLLPPGHPLGNTNNVSRDDIAQYFSSTFPIKEDQDLVYEILSTAPNSVERDFLINRINPYQYAIVAAVEAADEMLPIEEQDWGPILEIYERLEDPRGGDDFEYYLVDEEGNETLFTPELNLYQPMFYGTHIFPDDPETNIESPLQEDQ